MKAWIGLVVAFVIIVNICDAKRVKRHGDEHHGCDDGEHGIGIDLHGESDWKCMEDKKWAVDYGANNVDKKCYNEEPAYHVCIDQAIDSLYKSDIPHSGPHRKVWAQYGEYNYLPPGRYVHNLEHGAVVFMYHPCAPVEMVEKLRQTATSCLYRYIVTAFPKLTKEYPFAVLTYGCVFRMSRVDASDIKQWIRQRFGHSPEPDVFGNGKYNHGLLTESFDPGSYDYNDVTKPFCPDVPEDASPVVTSLPPAFHNLKESNTLPQETDNKKSSLQQNTFPDTTVGDWRNFVAKFATQNNLKTGERGYEVTSIPSYEEWQNFENTSPAEEKDVEKTEFKNYPTAPMEKWKNFDAKFPTENNADNRERGYDMTPVPDDKKEQSDWQNSPSRESDMKESNILVESSPDTKPKLKPLDTSPGIDANEHSTKSESTPHAKESDMENANFENVPTETSSYQSLSNDAVNEPEHGADANIRPMVNEDKTPISSSTYSARLDTNGLLPSSESAPYAKKGDMEVSNLADVPDETSYNTIPNPVENVPPRPLSNKPDAPNTESKYGADADEYSNVDDARPLYDNGPTIISSTSVTVKSEHPLTSVNFVDFSQVPVTPSSDQVPVYFWGAVALGCFVIGLLLGVCGMNICKTKRGESMKRYKVWSDRNSADSFSIAAVVRKIPDSFMNRKQNDDYQRLEANDQSSDDENPV